jgi:hypothetical protein
VNGLVYRGCVLKRTVLEFCDDPIGVLEISALPGLFLARESMISDILAGDGKMANLFYSV